MSEAARAVAAMTAVSQMVADMTAKIADGVGEPIRRGSYGPTRFRFHLRRMLRRIEDLPGATCTGPAGRTRADHHPAAPPTHPRVTARTLLAAPGAPSRLGSAAA